MTAKQLTLSVAPSSPSEVMVDMIGGGAQHFSVDFTMSGSVFDWSGLALDGILTAGDVIRFGYVS